MVNTQDKTTYLSFLDSVVLNEEEKKEEQPEQNEDVPEEPVAARNEEPEEEEQKDVNFLSSTDMKIALCNFLNVKDDYKGKLESLEEFLSEVLLQIITKRKKIEADPNIAKEYEEKGEADFFEMFYDILVDGLAKDKLAFLNAYLESKSIDERCAIVESVGDNSLEKLLGDGVDVEKAVQNMTPEQVEELKKKSKELSAEERANLFRVLGKYWKNASSSELGRAALAVGMSSVNPALGFVSQLLTGGISRMIGK